MSSPAERYAQWQATERHRRASGLPPAGDLLVAFQQGYSFPLDDFQVQACEALTRGESVLVAAPTGSGKTVVGEFAVELALASGRKCFYTTPIKALSNQKYRDLVQRHGEASVGLLTGDNSINGDALIVVMTTEVLRNMLYAGSGTLTDLAYVVMDEVHYLADRFRGAVWEEVIIHLPDSVTLAALSATVSNAEEFGAWIETVRGRTSVIVSEHRPVPLWQQVMVGRQLYDLFADNEHRAVNPELQRFARDEERLRRMRDHRPKRGHRRGRPPGVPGRRDVVETLGHRDLLPAIYFIFSRAGCDGAVRQLLQSGVRLNDPESSEKVRRIVEDRTAHLTDEDLRVLEYDDFVEGLRRGFAAHHAGLLPVFKEIVEDLFAQGLVMCVFATETLALGVNMPARTVVIEKLSKWNGETHAEITAAEYTQLTGRAGRRGIDVEGDAVVLWQPGFDPQSLAGLASTRTYPLRSSFRPTYNMAVNLVRQMGRHTAREILETSFAQFQADRAVVGLAKQLRKNEEGLAGYREAMTCHLGDFTEYSDLRRALSDREKALARANTSARRAEVAKAIERLRPGDVVRLPGGRRSKRLGVVIETDNRRGFENARPVVLTEDRQVRKFAGTDFTDPPEPLARMTLPKGFRSRDAQARRLLASRLRELDTSDGGKRRARDANEDAELADLRARLRSHPCHSCPDREEHARWAERWHRLNRETRNLQKRVDDRTGNIARTFDRVIAVLEEIGYLDGDTVTPEGERLARLYTELDLVVAESLRLGLWKGLSAAELAAVVSVLVFEARRDPTAPPKLPGGAARTAIEETMRLADDLTLLERDHRLRSLREPDAGFAWAAYRWASGHRLEAVLSESELAAGDFVRWCKQLIDLLGQVVVATAADDDGISKAAREAVVALRRGVVDVSSED
ncbi:MAG TPA: DEAD/DEAH box helicase [Actinomycetes bacterium]|nr:DEAD/DEAH box helicase [Actinomycetes bacterium]